MTTNPGYVALNINAEKEEDALKSKNLWRVSLQFKCVLNLNVSMSLKV